MILLDQNEHKTKSIIGQNTRGQEQNKKIYFYLYLK